MKLRVLICLVLMLIIVSDVTIVAAAHYDISVTMHAFRSFTATPGPVRPLTGSVSINGVHYSSVDIPGGTTKTFNVTRAGYINTLYLDSLHGVHSPAGGGFRKIVVVSAKFRVYQQGHLVAEGSGLGLHHVNLTCPPPPPPTPINLSHALNFTLAGAMALPMMTVDIVDDIMLTVGKHIKCGLAKFAIRAALLKFAAKGVAVTIAITGISYLLAEFADDIYNAIFATIPEINPGDSHFHETEIPKVMDVINTYFPTEPHIRNAIEQSIRLHIDAHGLISIADVIQIIRNHQNNIVIDIYKETPEILPENININRYQVPEIMDMIDIYFPVELPVRNIIEQEIYRNIDNDKFNEIPFNEIINIIEQEQHIFIPEVPTQTPQEHQQYIDDIINKIIHEAPYIPTIEAAPFIFQGIPATPIIPRTPTRPKEKIHTFPFYSLFVDPLAAVIGITLAHLFAAMMIIGAIISIGATWGTIGAIFAGFIGTITTAYFGLTSWLIPVFLIVLLIIYANIRIKGGFGKE